MPQNKISVILITGNVEENIKDCMESIKWVDEITVEDFESTDKTMNLKTGYKVYLYLLLMHLLNSWLYQKYGS